MTPPRTTASDIPRGTWIDRRVPEALRPYLRLARIDRPIGSWLLLLPCWWGLVLASPGLTPAGPLAWLALLFALGAVAMRGAGCTLNDIVDRRIDARVARTADRPIPSGAVSLRAAFVFLGLQLLVGLFVLLWLNPFTMILAAASLVLVAAYPFMKRITFWPQAWLGLTINWGALVGYAAVAGTIRPEALLLYAAGLFWTLGYDTLYAHQDKEDDRVLGVKSLALRLGNATRPWLAAFYGTCLALIAAAGAMAGLHPAFYGFLVLAGLHLGWQVASCAIDDPGNCLDRFRSNRGFGLLVLLALAAGQGF